MTTILPVLKALKIKKKEIVKCLSRKMCRNVIILHTKDKI